MRYEAGGCAIVISMMKLGPKNCW